MKLEVIGLVDVVSQSSSGDSSNLESLVKTNQQDISNIKSDYLKSSDKTELQTLITNNEQVVLEELTSLDNKVINLTDSISQLQTKINWSVLLPSPISLCDIAYWDGNAVKTVSKDNWSTSLGTPIGIVVIPEGMLPDGKARMVGLSPVDANGNPSSSHVGMTWGTYGTDTSLTNYTKVPTTDNAGSTSTGSNGSGFLPSDIFTSVTSYIDSGAKYQGNTPYIPSPYLYNGGELAFNPEYSKAISGYNNALSDFNGLSNTETLVGLGTDYTAANVAWKYSDGVSNTQWYLPAAGELGFLMPRLQQINSTLTSIEGVAIRSSGNFWSSSEYSSSSAYNLQTSNGFINNDYGHKDYSCYVRVFGIIN